MTDCRLCEHYMYDNIEETSTIRVWCNKTNITMYSSDDCPYYTEVDKE